MKLFMKISLWIKEKCSSILKKEDKKHENMVYLKICKNVGSSYLSNEKSVGQK